MHLCQEVLEKTFLIKYTLEKKKNIFNYKTNKQTKPNQKKQLSPSTPCYRRTLYPQR